MTIELGINAPRVKCPCCRQTFGWLRNGYKVPAHRVKYRVDFSDQIRTGIEKCKGVGRTVYPMEA